MGKLERQAAIMEKLHPLFTWVWISGHYEQAEEDEWHTCRVRANEVTEEKARELNAVLDVDWKTAFRERMWPRTIDPAPTFAFEFKARLKHE